MAELLDSVFDQNGSGFESLVLYNWLTSKISFEINIPLLYLEKQLKTSILENSFLGKGIQIDQRLLANSV